MWDWLFGKKKPQEEKAPEPARRAKKRAAAPRKPKASVDSLSFDLTDCTLQEQGKQNRCWLDSAHVAHALQFADGPPVWPFDLTDPDAAADFYRKQCAENGGVMLSMSVTTVDGREALQGIFKYRAPEPNALAKYYVGILWIPFQEANFQVNVEAMERGRTGIREAAVAVMEADSWPKPPADTPPIRVKSAAEMFERMKATPVRQLPSDDERHDRTFPDHPLSVVRARLAKVIQTAELDPTARALTPFRLGE